MDRQKKRRSIRLSAGRQHLVLLIQPATSAYRLRTAISVHIPLTHFEQDISAGLVRSTPASVHAPDLAARACADRTVTSALRILGRERDPDFCTFHRILNRAAWSSRVVAGRLLVLLIAAFVPTGAPVVIGLDDTIERRWGPKISARGIYRDPVRSSKGHFVKASGLRWLSAMLLVRVPWADRIMALPFLTLFAPSKRFYTGKSRAPKTLLDWASTTASQICSRASGS
jgi:DDE superfamily endonuclease